MKTNKHIKSVIIASLILATSAMAAGWQHCYTQNPVTANYCVDNNYTCTGQCSQRTYVGRPCGACGSGVLSCTTSSFLVTYTIATADCSYQWLGTYNCNCGTFGPPGPPQVANCNGC